MVWLIPGKPIRATLIPIMTGFSILRIFFPLIPGEWADNDGDGTGDNADPDDDNDGMPDTYESANGLDPFVDDLFQDNDNDGFSNFREYLAGTSPTDGLELPPMIADADTDNDVDASDMSLFIDSFNSTGCSISNPCGFDLDGDGDVDQIDLLLFSEDFGRDGD